MAECAKYWYRSFYGYKVERKELAITKDKAWNEESFEIGNEESILFKENKLK